MTPTDFEQPSSNLVLGDSPDSGDLALGVDGSLAKLPAKATDWKPRP
jgi:hypothetical protein